MINSTLDYLRKYTFLLVIVVIGWILTLIPFILDGQYGCINGKCGMIIGTNYRDGAWFLSVAATAFRTFPFQMPVFSGAELQGYHYLPNLGAYILSLTGVPITFTYYKIIPIVFVSCLTILAIYFSRKIKDDPRFVGLFLFFVFFGMHLSLITSLYHTGKIQNGALINTFQATRLLESPHAALAVLMLLVTLILIYKKTHFEKKHLMILWLMIFLAFGTKFYVAATILLILGWNELFLLIKTKNTKQFFLHIGVYSLSMIAAVLLFYNPFGATKSGSIFILSPFATVHHMIESPNLFYMHDMILARYFLYEAGWSPRLLFIELFSVWLFVLYYFGTRVIGFFYILKQVASRKITRFELVVTITILMITTFSVLFIQKGDWFNPIQFAVPAAFLTNIFAAKFLYDVLQKKKILGWILIGVICIITFPANLVNLGYPINPARYVISSQEMDALNFLKKEPNGAVFYPSDENDMSYVSAFTGKPLYVNFTNVLENADIDFKPRLNEVKNLNLLNIDNLDVTYLYIPLNTDTNKRFVQRLKKSSQVQIIYENNDAFVFKKN